MHVALAGWEKKACDRIVMKFCTLVEVRPTQANFGDYRFRRFGLAGVEFLTFPLNPLTCVVVSKHSGTSVLACD